jgi:hypothetical protein
VPRDLPVPGRELDGVHFAMDYLYQRNRWVAREFGPEPTVAQPALEREITAENRDVVVIGGGDTGADCVGNALRSTNLAGQNLLVQGGRLAYRHEFLLACQADRHERLRSPRLQGSVGVDGGRLPVWVTAAARWAEFAERLFRRTGPQASGQVYVLRVESRRSADPDGANRLIRIRGTETRSGRAPPWAEGRTR